MSKILLCELCKHDLANVQTYHTNWEVPYKFDGVIYSCKFRAKPADVNGFTQCGCVKHNLYFSKKQEEMKI